MRLGKKQELFAVAQAKLVLYADSLGYGIRPKHLLRCLDCKVGKTNSVHKLGIAIDLVLTQDDKIITDSAVFNMLHDHWDKLGGARRIAVDLGHFSFEHEGRW